MATSQTIDELVRKISVENVDDLSTYFESLSSSGKCKLLIGFLLINEANGELAEKCSRIVDLAVQTNIVDSDWVRVVASLVHERSLLNTQSNISNVLETSISDIITALSSKIDEIEKDEDICTVIDQCPSESCYLAKPFHPTIQPHQSSLPVVDNWEDILSSSLTTFLETDDETPELAALLEEFPNLRSFLSASDYDVVFKVLNRKNVSLQAVPDNEIRKIQLGVVNDATHILKFSRDADHRIKWERSMVRKKPKK